MTKRRWIIVILFALVTASCNLPADQTTTATPLSTPALDTPTIVVSTPTLVPIETLLAIDTSTVAPTATQTSSVILASPKDQPVNCRFGPGISYAVTGILNLGRQAEITGRNQDSSWWQVKNPSDPSTLCWLAASVTDTVGNVESLPVASSPVIGVTGIQVTVDPPAMNVSCFAFPQFVNVSAQITTNGPAVVTWRWESSAGNSTSDENLLFEEGGTKTVQYAYKVVSANDYWIQVHTVSPNDTTGRAYFKVTCGS